MTRHRDINSTLDPDTSQLSELFPVIVNSLLLKIASLELQLLQAKAELPRLGAISLLSDEERKMLNELF
ncbi:hypothetical protein FM037_06615 [Shewanella psychropiezotolerans]|uniref:Uncharacterized protein n=1 Tax=Shewanella psychropiezotolerans TaxID=2593655 RepID=A0ABX5WV37_9GAMM|nr:MULTISPECIES: hypothetical protein [Shewanella]MPY22760.1 hypothetical protein [Shewanella sp. YLB-07]QDO82960.1 hypothetical protein FM037_06615 [Shewanella psychropiezotolerans]